MKLVVAIIKPFKLDDVKAAVQALGVQGLTTTNVQGFGRQRGHTEVYRGAEYTVEFVPKIKVEILVDDGDAARLVETLIEAARTGSIGDGHRRRNRLRAGGGHGDARHRRALFVVHDASETAVAALGRGVRTERDAE